MLCQWLESEAGAISYTFTELHDKMKEISDNSEVNTIKRLKQKLRSRNIIKNSYSLQKLRGVVMFYALRIWQNILKWHSKKKANIEDEVFYWNVLFFYWHGYCYYTHTWSSGDYNNLSTNGFSCILLLYSWLKVN